ncbi:MAG: hypothetical protein KAW45_01825 [Thermoplasmatales archaeon]|nr:hypothetical protein [Thermoplasmatales archaeon]
MKAKKRKFIEIGAVVFLLLTLASIPVINAERNIMEPPTLVAGIEGSLGGIDIPIDEYNIDIDRIPDCEKSISEEEIIIWENKEATQAYEIAYITVQLEGIDGEQIQSDPPMQPLGFYIRYYTVKAHNLWGWTMFKLCARGYFFGFGDKMMFVYPVSYANVEWWCAWAWSVDYIEDSSSINGDTGRVDAEAGFKYFLGEGLVELWAYVKCNTNGQASGNGGQL